MGNVIDLDVREVLPFERHERIFVVGGADQADRGAQRLGTDRGAETGEPSVTSRASPPLPGPCRSRSPRSGTDPDNHAHRRDLLLLE
jgi:hypothetical protein